jgi:hypothetical protein
MASYYEALPIYNAATNVAVRVDAVVQRFAKGHKYTLGGASLRRRSKSPCSLRGSIGGPSVARDYSCFATASKS